MKFVFKVEKNKLIPEDLKLFRTSLKEFEGSNVIISIKKEKSKRTSAANRYYWGVIVELATVAIRDEGNDDWTPEDTHEMFKEKFLSVSKMIKTKQGKRKIRKIKSTGNLSKEEFNLYIEKCIDFCTSFLGISLPDLNGYIINGQVLHNNIVD